MTKTPKETEVHNDSKMRNRNVATTPQDLRHCEACQQYFRKLVACTGRPKQTIAT